MLSITDGGSLSRALSSSFDPHLKELLRNRCAALGGDPAGQAHFLLVQGGDQIPSIEATLGFSPFVNPVDGRRHQDPDFVPCWEWIEDHGHCFEVVFIFDDSGFAHVLLIEQREGVPAELLDLCRQGVAAI